MKVSIKNIPAELHHLKQWVCWRKGTDDKGRVTKIPVNPHTGGNAMVNNESTWSDMMDAVVAASRYDLAGIGFILTNGYFGIDLDDCSVELRNEFIEGMQSYTEISQSGNGIHIICKGALPEGPRRRGGIEMYDKDRFFVMTGNVVGNYDIADCSQRVLPLYEKYLLNKEKPKTQSKSEVFHKPVNLTDNDVLKKAQSAKNGTQFKMLYDGQWEDLNYPSQSEADLALCNLLAFWCNKNEEQMDRLFRMSGLYRDKWDRKQSGTTYGAITIQTAVTNAKSVYTSAHHDERSITVNAKTGEVSFQRKVNYELNDTGNAQRFVDRYAGFVRFNFENKYWMIWNGKYWGVDVTHQIKSYAEVIIDDMKVEAFQEEDENTRKVKFANVQRAYSSRGKENLLKEAMHQQNIPCVNDDFDNLPMFLNVNNGIINLETGELLEHSKEFMMKSIVDVDYDPDAKPPEKWINFLDEILLGDKELIYFIQKAIGYTLTGSIKEQCLFICHGDGDNGKSVFTIILSRLLGDYAVNAQVDTLLEKRGQSTNTSDLARLKGARFVTTGENNEGAKLNEGLVKQMTGGEKITARFLYGTEFEFHPEYKIWISTNHKPIIRGTDKGIWRRINAIPFNFKVQEKDKDKDLIFKLAEELPQIMKWAVEGCLAWQREGLEQPPSIVQSTQEYKNEMDVINTFIEEAILNIDDWETPAGEVYKVYEKWAKDSNEYVMSLTKFGKELAKKYEKVRRSHGVVYKGMQLRKDNPAYVFQKHNV